MNRLASVGLCGALVLVGAVVHAGTTHRWSAVRPNPERAAAVHSLVLNLGERDILEVPSEMPVKERSTCTCRQYRSTTGGTPVVVSITSGPAGAVATHTPDVCYPAGGYKTVKPPKKETLDLPGGGTATVLVAEFEKANESGVPDRQKIRWAWTTDGKWDVPNNPRFAFVPWFASPQGTELYKLYVVTPVGPNGRRIGGIAGRSGRRRRRLRPVLRRAGPMTSPDRRTRSVRPLRDLAR